MVCFTYAQSLALALATVSIIVLPVDAAKPRRQAIQFIEERHVKIERRNRFSPYAFQQSEASVASQKDEILAFFSPSPAADPIPITEQSQVVTSFAPQFTVCVLPPVLFVPMNETEGQNSTSPSNGTAANDTEPSFVASIPDGGGRCSTAFRPVPTTVCATILTGLATRVTITDCEQEVTFSSRLGFSMETPAPTVSTIWNNSTSAIAPSPRIQTLMTYYRAPWQYLTAGYAPRDVEAVACRMNDDGTHDECVEARELWTVVPVTKTGTITVNVDFSTTVTGPARIWVETLEMDVTKKMTDISLSTTMLLEYEFESDETGKEDIPAQTTAPQMAETTEMTALATEDDFDSDEEYNASDTEDRITSTITRTRTRTATFTIDDATSA